jgi:hypothetical protein
LVPLKVDAQFKDVNGHDHNLTEIFNMIVLSGPPTAMSLSYVGTAQDSSKAKFIDRWALTVTDRYNNLVNTHPAVSTGALVGFIQDSSHTATNAQNYLYFEPGASGGDINATDNTFTAPNGVFANVDQTNDILTVFGSGYTYQASGKWDIQTNSNSVLDLVDDYNDTFVSDLGFAIGHNYRQVTCDPGVERVANVYTDGNSSIIDDSGSLIVNIEYDYYLVGKDAMLWVNLVGVSGSGNQARLGEAQKVTLRGNGIEGESFAYPKGYSGKVRLKVKISNTVEYYRNARFGYTISVGDDTNWSFVEDSMGNGISSCADSLGNDTDGIAYVDVNITGSATAGTLSLVNMLLGNEF